MSADQTAKEAPTHVLTVLYKHPADRSHFDSHYLRVHAPLILKVPGLQNLTARHLVSLEGGLAPYYFIAQLEFASRADCEHAMSSAEFAAAAADGPNFAGAGLDVMLAHD